MRKERIDTLLVSSGFAESIRKAQAMVMAGIVLVNERRVDKPSDLIEASESIRIKGATPESKYVGRGGLKLEAALNEFHICPDEYTCLDIGASTGGFTDCLLQRGATKVYAIDVGTNQLDWKLRNDSRVVSREKVNARTLSPSDFDEKFDLIVIDVSFISLKKIMGSLVPLFGENARIIALIKPQFEVEKGEVGKGGIVREKEKHDKVISGINEFALHIGLSVKGLIESPILGAKGNKEFLALYEQK